MRPRRELARGLAAGFVGGLAGGVAMSLFSAAWARLLPASRGEPLQYPPPANRPRPPIAQGTSALAASQQEWDSTEAAAQAVLRRELLPRQRIRAAIAMHFAVSAAAGALYGVSAELLPQSAAGCGVVFGTGLWALAQELAMPALRWSRPLNRYSPAMQLNSLGEHVAFGVTTELVRRAARKVL